MKSAVIENLLLSRQRSRLSRFLSLVGWLSAIVFVTYGSQAVSQSTTAVRSLQPGSVLPDVSGETISGGPSHLLGLLNGKVAIVTFSFSKAGGEDAKLWNEHFDHEWSGNPSVACSTVIELQDAPKLLRGIIKSALSRDMPAYVRSRIIVTYQDEALWKRRLGVTDNGHAYVLVLGENDEIRWRSTGAFNASEFGELEKTVREQLRASTTP
jgi:hypothetical protein